MSKPLMPRRFWSESELARLREIYPSTPTKKVAHALGRTISGVSGTAYKLGLRKRQEYIKREVGLQKGTVIGRAWRFKKGDEPANKGLRRPGWYAGRMKETQFKKGQRSGKAAQNWRPIGTILPDCEGYLRIKVREAVHGEPYGFGNTKVWPLLNRYVWEQHHGPNSPEAHSEIQGRRSGKLHNREPGTDLDSRQHAPQLHLGPDAARRHRGNPVERFAEKKNKEAEWPRTK